MIYDPHTPPKGQSPPPPPPADDSPPQYSSIYEYTPSPTPDAKLHPPLSLPHDPLPAFSSSSSAAARSPPRAPSPPPPAFLRRAPPHLAYPAFAPTSLPANGKYLDSGFPPRPPPAPSPSAPHPFATHDVTREDWTTFLAEIQKAASLSTAQKVGAIALPVALIGAPGILLSRAVRGGMKHRKRKAAGRLVDVWNSEFFGRRGMEVVLARGGRRESGGAGAGVWEGEMERLNMQRPATRGSVAASSSSSASSAASLSEPGHGAKAEEGDMEHSKGEMRALKRTRRAEKDARRAERGGRRAERKRAREDDKGKRRKDDKTWRLYVLPLDPPVVRI